MTSNIPTAVALHRKSKCLELRYADGTQWQLPAEFLRAFSPSAEVRGHGKGQAVLQTGKRLVGIDSVEAVGHYAIKISFDDGHNSGLYSWDYLAQLGSQQDAKWAQYLQDLASAGASRDKPSVTASLSDPVQVINIAPLSTPKS
jgi:DUF971 family protein